MIGRAYTTSEDSELLRQALGGYSGGSCLEIGAGNGGTLMELAKRYGQTVGTDLVSPDMKDWSDRADYVLADLASCFGSESFDLVAMNPPYLRSDGGDVAVDGGLDLEVPKRFLRDGLRVVKRSGTVVFLLNSDADLGEFEEICEAVGFEMRRLLSKRVFYEELAVYAATRKQELR